MLHASFSSQSQTIEAGCDEAGRGCLAGPVVAAAVILPHGYRHKELNDSKKMTPNARKRVRKDIERDALAWAIAESDNQEIDTINILNASMEAFHKALDKLSIQPHLLLIDGNWFAPYQAIPFHCIIQGDSKYLSVAAASVLAKTHRDELMQHFADLYPGYGWERNKGYPTPQHRDSIKRLGVTPLHRKSFRLL